MLRRTLAVATFAAAMTGTLAAPAAGALAGGHDRVSASEQTDLIALVNDYRANKGLQQVVPNGTLAAAAAWMAADMAAKGYVGHVSSDGRSPTQRMSAFGYPATAMYTGEDLAAGYGTAGAVLAGWQASAAHNAILLNQNFNAIGVGLVYNASSTYKWYWAADFGGPGGTVKVVLPPAPAASARPADVVSAPGNERAAPAPRGSEAEGAEDTHDAEAEDPEIAASAARIAALDRIDERRMAHLLAVLERMGEI